MRGASPPLPSDRLSVYGPCIALPSSVVSTVRSRTTRTYLLGTTPVSVHAFSARADLRASIRSRCVRTRDVAPPAGRSRVFPTVPARSARVVCRTLSRPCLSTPSPPVPTCGVRPRRSVRAHDVAQPAGRSRTLPTVPARSLRGVCRRLAQILQTPSGLTRAEWPGDVRRSSKDSTCSASRERHLSARAALGPLGLSQIRRGYVKGSPGSPPPLLPADVLRRCSLARPRSLICLLRPYGRAGISNCADELAS